jgi:hypothetical protein
MSWTYEQSTGRLLHDGAVVATGYAGRDEGLNNPTLEHVRDTGPLPAGRYRIGPPFRHPRLGAYSLPLAPLAGVRMHGRGGFYIHGDNRTPEPHDASHGCIIVARAVRELIWASGDRFLEVVSTISERDMHHGTG